MKMGAAGYQHVKDNFQFRNYYEQIEKILQNLMQEGKNKGKGHGTESGG